MLSAPPTAANPTNVLCLPCASRSSCNILPARNRRAAPAVRHLPKEAVCDQYHQSAYLFTINARCATTQHDVGFMQRSCAMLTTQEAATICVCIDWHFNRSYGVGVSKSNMHRPGRVSNRQSGKCIKADVAAASRQLNNTHSGPPPRCDRGCGTPYHTNTCHTGPVTPAVCKASKACHIQASQAAKAIMDCSANKARKALAAADLLMVPTCCSGSWQTGVGLLQQTHL